MSNIISCQNCGLSELCIPYSLSLGEVELVDAKIKRHKPLRKNETLFEIHKPFHSIFVVRSGAVKTYTLSAEGDEHVVDFYLPGELLGLDAIGGETYNNTAKALETSSLCEIPYAEMTALSQQIPNLQVHMYRVLSREIRDDQNMQLLLNKKTAEQRIASFIFNLAERHKIRKLSSSMFRLPMIRTDIANYLGLAVETTSRIFTRLQENGVILVKGKEIEILDQHKLCQLAHCEPTAT